MVSLEHCLGCGGEPDLIVLWEISMGPQTGAFCRPCLAQKSSWLNQFGAVYLQPDEYAQLVAESP